MEDLLKPDDEMLTALATELGLMSIVVIPEPAAKKAEATAQPTTQGVPAV